VNAMCFVSLFQKKGKKQKQQQKGNGNKQQKEKPKVNDSTQ